MALEVIDTDEVRHTFGHLPIVLHVCDEVDRLRAEIDMAREYLLDVATVPCVHGSATSCRADPDRDTEDYCGGCLADDLLARLEAAPLAVPDVQVRDRSAVVARTRRQQRE